MRCEALSFIGPHGYLQLLPMAKAEDTTWDSSCRRRVGPFLLYDSTLVLRDRVTYGAQTENMSQGRYPDGSYNIVTFTSPTPGASNYVISYAGPRLKRNHGAQPHGRDQSRRARCRLGGNLQPASHQL